MEALTVAQKVIDALANAKEMDDVIDGSDAHGEVQADGSVTFNMTKWIDRPSVMGRRGAEPVGMVTYKVTIHKTYERFDDEG